MESPDGLPPAALQSALAASIASGTFTDTAYYLYSRRLPSGRICTPQVVYASSTVLKAAGKHFIAQIDGGFDLNQRLEHDTDAYGYDEDSDLEDIDEDLNEVTDEVTGSNTQDAAADGSKDDVDASGCKAKVVTDGKDKNLEQSTVADAPQQDERWGVKYRITVPDVAANTWHALVYYIYSGKINFAPLRSQGVIYRTQAIDKHKEKNPDLPPLCSPKSVYRLADIVGLDGLKKLAHNEIRNQMSARTVVHEAFSRFSSFYPDVLDTQVNSLYDDGLMSRVIPIIQHKLKEIAEGNMPHAENIMGILVLKLSSLLLDHEKQQTSKTDDLASHPCGHYEEERRATQASEQSVRVSHSDEEDDRDYTTGKGRYANYSKKGVGNQKKSKRS